MHMCVHAPADIYIYGCRRSGRGNVRPYIPSGGSPRAHTRTRSEKAAENNTVHSANQLLWVSCPETTSPVLLFVNRQISEICIGRDVSRINFEPLSLDTDQTFPRIKGQPNVITQYATDNQAAT